MIYDEFQIIPIILSAWLTIKSGCEIWQTHHAYKKDDYVEDSIIHTHQHLGILYGLFIYGIIVIIMILFGAVFDLEWMGVHFLINVVLLYVVEHFADERVGVIKPTRFRDIFWVRKRSKKEKHLHNED